MTILRTRRIAQVFFLVLFLWFCMVTTVGEHWWQLRGWPVNWFLQLDPLVALGTLLTTHKIYAGLLWALLTIIVTMLLGRFFCGWVCPFGCLHQMLGWLGRPRSNAERVAQNQYHRAQRLKYYLLFGLLTAAAFGVLQTGLLDPIPLMQRSVNLVIQWAMGGLGVVARVSVAGWLMLALFVTALFLNFWVPRFYCRFICPLGALFGLLVRWSPWRIGKRKSECNECQQCERDCEGACAPFGQIRLSECLMCLNCLQPCRQGQMTYGPNRSAAGEIPSPDVNRRGFLVAVISGLVTRPAAQLAGARSSNWNAGVVRPPGALAESDFLDRCLKCGQCLRACPTNVLQPALLEAGLEGLWTPTLNFRAGSSGCQLICIACGQVCPTAAIRPLTIDEKLGRGPFEATGAVRIGVAFVDRNRCLPWAMNLPCIVCQENCPVSPKAIYVREEFQLVRDGVRTIKSADATSVTLDGPDWPAGKLATGDYFVRLETAPGSDRRLITANANASLTVAGGAPWKGSAVAGQRVFIEVRLQQPLVDLERCIGCGICQHECPVGGLQAIRVTAENESRNQRHSLTAKA